MLPGAQGGAAASYARLLAFFTICSSLLTGCHSKQELLPATRHSVRLNTLLSLHPAWSQVIALDQETAQFASSQQQSASLHYAALPLPTPFAPPDALPASLTKEREKRVKEDAQRYTKHLEQSLRAINDQVLTREKKIEQKRINSEYAAAVIQEETAQRDHNRIEAISLQYKINKLIVREAYLVARIREYTDLGLKEPQALQDELRQLRDTMDSLEKQRAALLTADITELAAAELKKKGTRRKLEMESQARLEARAGEMESLLAQQLDQARPNVTSEPIPPLASTPLPPPDTRVTPLELPPAVHPDTAFVQAQEQVRVSLEKQRGIWKARRNELIAGIRADTEKAVAQIARKEGWIVAAEGDPQAADATESVAESLRAQWKPHLK